MTRFARVPKRKHLDATPWNELNDSGSRERSQSLEQQEKSAAEKQKKKTTKSKHIHITDADSEPASRKKLKKNHYRDQTAETASDVTSDVKVKKRAKEHPKEKHEEKRSPLKGKSAKKISRSEKSEKMKEARRQRRQKSKLCFSCREPGHRLSDCPRGNRAADSAESCYKCGMSGHTSKQCDVETSEDNLYPFAKCFICKETGHVSGQCPDNPKGLYPNGGGCKCCGSVEHFKRDCPENPQNFKSGSRAEAEFSAHSSFRHKGHLSADSQANFDEALTKQKPKKKGRKVVVF